MGFIGDLIDEGPIGWLLLLLLIGVIALIPISIWASMEEFKHWKAFSEQHHCKVVGRMSGDTVTTVAPIIGGSGGVAVGVSSTPSKTGYLCDNGVTYWR